MAPPQASTPLNARATPSPFDRNHDLPHLRNGKGRQYDQNNTSSLSHEQVEGLRRQSNLSTLSLSPRRPSFAPSAAARTRRTTPLPFSTGADADESSFLGQSVDEGAPWTMVDRMRNWRNDAMTQHLYDSAKFWGGKVLGMTGAYPLPRYDAVVQKELTSALSQATRMMHSGSPRSTFSRTSLRKPSASSPRPTLLRPRRHRPPRLSALPT